MGDVGAETEAVGQMGRSAEIALPGADKGEGFQPSRQAQLQFDERAQTLRKSA